VKTIPGLSRQLRLHELEDEKRFDALDKSFSRVSGQLYLLLALVLGSGALNYFHA